MIKTKCTKDSGFTLIEIIAVLLILAVLAAVAIPRYLTLINEARLKALQGALAAGYSHVSLIYAKDALAVGTPPTTTDLAKAAGDNPPTGDFGWGFAVSDDPVGVEITVTDPVDASFQTNGVWVLP